MAQINLPYTLTPGTPENVGDVMDNFTEIKDHINNALIGDDNLTAGTVLTPLGLGATRRGVKVTATQESRTNTAYGTLTTADTVTVTVPTNGLIFVQFSAQVLMGTASATGNVGLFVGATQARTVLPAVATHQPLEDNGGGISPDWDYVFTSPGAVDQASGSIFWSNVSGGDATDPGVTPNAIGQPIAIDVPAGTYAVSVQFKASSGSISARNRKLRVWTMGF